MGLLLLLLLLKTTTRQHFAHLISDFKADD
jgi:hypothetical protein